MFGHRFESYKIKALISSAVAVLSLLSVCVKSLACLSMQLCESVRARLSRLLLFITCLLSLPEAMWSVCVRAFVSVRLPSCVRSGLERVYSAAPD